MELSIRYFCVTTLMLEGKAYRRWCSTLLCWLSNVARVTSLHLCPGLLGSGTASSPPARSIHFTITVQLLTNNTCQEMHKHVCDWLTYLVGSSRFWSFIWAGMICVARGPESYGWGSCPLNSDWMKCSCQLEIRKKHNQSVTVMPKNDKIHLPCFFIENLCGNPAYWLVR